MPESDDGKPANKISWKDAIADLLGEYEVEPEADDVPVDTLGDATASEASDAEADLKNEQAKADLTETHDKNGLRKEFFNWAKGAMTASIVINGLGMAAYVVSQWGDLSDGVMVGWFATTIVEVLGIGYIIGNYLFNGNGKSSAKAAS